MNAELVNSLLYAVTKWDDSVLAKEQPILEFMGSMKYDSYDQFMPGARFLASFVQWLSQFDDEDKDIVYKLIKERLIFISSSQMSYLIDLLYSTKIKPIINAQAAKILEIPQYFVSKIERSDAFVQQKRLSLMVGLSDGAHMDILRRSAGFNNEQVLTNYYPNEEKLKGMLEKLGEEKSLKGMDQLKFKTLFLIDDFTASGTSFVRKENNDYKGKLVKVLKEIQKKGASDKLQFGDLFDEKLEIHLLFCIATEYAINKIRNEINECLVYLELNDKLKVIVDYVQIIENPISEQIKNNAELENVLMKSRYFDKDSVMSESYLKGKHDKPYWGFDECALPIVLSHNTPNNSLPILWQNEVFKGLFPRISRH